MSFKRRATGRAEMLKRNQQRKKKAAAKPAAKQSTTKTAFSGKSLMNVPKVRPMNATKTAFSGKSLMETPKTYPVAPKPPKADKPVKNPTATTTPKDKPKSSTSGQSMPSNPPGMRQTRGTDKTSTTSRGLSNRQKYRRGGKPAKTGSNPLKTLQSVASRIDKTLNLTHKKGDTKKIGNTKYRWNGKKWVVIGRDF